MTDYAWFPVDLKTAPARDIFHSTGDFTKDPQR